MVMIFHQNEINHEMNYSLKYYFIGNLNFQRQLSSDHNGMIHQSIAFNEFVLKNMWVFLLAFIVHIEN